MKQEFLTYFTSCPRAAADHPNPNLTVFRLDTRSNFSFKVTANKNSIFSGERYKIMRVVMINIFLIKVTQAFCRFNVFVLLAVSLASRTLSST